MFDPNFNNSTTKPLTLSDIVALNDALEKAPQPGSVLTIHPSILAAFNIAQPVE